MDKNKTFENTEIDVILPVGDQRLNGILSLPAGQGPFPAIVLLHGSDRSGKDDPYYAEHADNLVRCGYAVLRYDGPGWGGQSSDTPGVETLESRTEEAISIIQHLQTRPDIQSDAIGLWGISQGGWICQMTAAAYDQVAFIIPVSGPGVTPAEQEVFRVRASSEAARFGEKAVSKAVLIRQLMVDIVMSAPEYRIEAQALAAQCGDGPWNEMMDLIYRASPVNPAGEYEKTIKLLTEISREPWAEYLHLDQVLPMLQNIPPEAWEMAKGQMRAVLNVNPADFLTRVRCPVLAIFGEDDTSIPVGKSVLLYKKYLKQARNKAVDIVVFPKAGHTIQADGGFAPGYFELMVNWLKDIALVNTRSRT
jgi:pimeloyl-ACP methyl ester carboxylesterase